MNDIDNVSLVSHYKYSFPDRVYCCKDSLDCVYELIGNCLVEKFLLINLDYDYRPINFSEICVGTSDKLIVDLGELFRIALLSGAKHILVAHNHLGTSVEPTESDIKTTKIIGQVSKLLNINLIDSIIINSKIEWISIRDYVNEKGLI